MLDVRVGLAYALRFISATCATKLLLNTIGES